MGVLTMVSHSSDVMSLHLVFHGLNLYRYLLDDGILVSQFVFQVLSV